MACKFVLAVALCFFQLRVHIVIPCLRPLATDVYFENCVTKPYYARDAFLLLSSDYYVLSSMEI